MKKTTCIVLILSIVLALFGCSTKAKLLGVWQNENEEGNTIEITEYEIIENTYIYAELLGVTIFDSTVTETYSYELGKDDTITIYSNGVSYVGKYSVKGDILTFYGDLNIRGTFRKTSDSVSWNTGNNATNQSSSNEGSITRDRIDSIANNEFISFVKNYHKENGNVVAYLPYYLDCEKTAEDKYVYSYSVFVKRSQNLKVKAYEVELTITILPNNERYEFSINQPHSSWISLKNVNDREMNIREYPDTSGDRKGTVDVNETVRVYGMNYDAFLNGSPYIWYSLNEEGSKWIADGIGAEKDYYRFENSYSTKDMVFVFRGDVQEQTTSNNNTSNSTSNSQTSNTQQHNNSSSSGKNGLVKIDLFKYLTPQYLGYDGGGQCVNYLPVDEVLYENNQFIVLGKNNNTFEFIRDNKRIAQFQFVINTPSGTNNYKLRNGDICTIQIKGSRDGNKTLQELGYYVEIGETKEYVVSGLPSLVTSPDEIRKEDFYNFYNRVSYYGIPNGKTLGEVIFMKAKRTTVTENLNAVAIVLYGVTGTDFTGFDYKIVDLEICSNMYFKGNQLTCISEERNGGFNRADGGLTGFKVAQSATVMDILNKLRGDFTTDKYDMYIIN